ncbi:MAG: ECF transporter S component [Bacillota bacterium]|nr:ECF transporter S component [Bacillota bacterium]
MNKSTKELTLSGMFLALAIIVPMIFHYANIGGAIFLPMHIPVLLAAFYVNPLYAMLVGILSPLLSSIFTSMPPMYPIAVIMVFELGVYGLVTSLIYKKFNLIISLIGGMITGRLVAGVMVFVLQSSFGLKMNPYMYIKGIIITGMPGIIIQLLIIPVIVKKFNLAINNKKSSKY